MTTSNLTKEERKNIAYKKYEEVHKLAYKKCLEVEQPAWEKYEEECRRIDNEEKIKCSKCGK